MPHKWYQGKTGVVWNVTKRALGVEINKRVRGNIIRKRIHVRIEHVQPSQSRSDFLRRRVENDAKRAQAKAKGIKLGPQKRLPAGPRAGALIQGFKMETVTAIPYDILKEGIAQ